MSEGELVSSDEGQSQSVSDDSRSSVENVSARASQCEELRLRWKKRDESHPTLEPSVGQEDNTKICTANLQDKVNVEMRRLELELENANSLEKIKKKRKTRRAKKQRRANDSDSESVADSQFNTVLTCLYKKCQGLIFQSLAAQRHHNKTEHQH